MKKYYEKVKGTLDFYPPRSILFKNVADKAGKLFKTFGYEEIILPVLEETGVFIKSVGQTSDIVRKQIFKIESKNIILRPEGTAQVVRFYIEKAIYRQRDFHKFFYIGPMFRGERPQKGRLRQFHHIGCEVFGSQSPYLDMEVIKLAMLILESCGVEKITLKLNSLGCEKDKKNFKNFLIRELEGSKEKLCLVCKGRVLTNPLRVLDCKHQSCKRVVSGLNLTKNNLCDSCRAHFEKVLSLLKKFNIPYDYDPTLVRGLDYYSNTVFEFVSSELGAKDACGAGGRYNDLVKNLGGPEIPAIGFALGVERMMLLIKEEPQVSTAKVFVAYTPRDIYPQAYKVLNSLRENGIPSDISYNDRPLKRQLRLAQKLGVDFTVIVGEEELKDGCLILRNMRESTQNKVKLDDLVAVLKENLC